MSKMKEIDGIENGVVEILVELIDHHVAWAVDDTIIDELGGDDFTDAIHQIRQNVVHKLNTKYNG
jgi:hypothetical protein